ncbi:MAG: rhomboid family intramembrane serine protease [bacterium]
MIPISDENPTLRTPVMTWLLLAAMFAVFLIVQGGGLDQVALVTSICNLGLIPGELTHQAALGTRVPMTSYLSCLVDRDQINLLTPLTSMFLHGGWGHLLGNALFFWVFGNNIEDSMGPGRFLAFYLLCGLIAAGTDVLMQPASPVPTVGASGAISGVLGAYLVLYPRVRVNMFFFLFVFAIPAWIVLIYWFGVQVLTAYTTPVRSDVSSGVAVWAHIGGFVAGMLLIKVFENPRLVAARNAIREQGQSVAGAF